MYKVKHKSSYYKTTFESYEKARQFIRKQIRKQRPVGSIKRDLYEWYGHWDAVSKSPTNFTCIGYKIVPMPS